MTKPPASHESRMQSPRTVVFALIAAACAVATAFFAFFGAQLAYTAVTFEGEGSLGHVGMYIAAVLFPFLALLFGAFTYLAWRTVARSLPP